jgi:hypothetical protein
VASTVFTSIPRWLWEGLNTVSSVQPPPIIHHLLFLWVQVL